MTKAERFSIQKNMTEQALRKLDHPSAAEIYEYIRKTYPRISLGTVYRNLAAMEEKGGLMRLSFPGEADRFDHNAREHYHMVCTACGRLMDVSGSIPRELLRNLDAALLKETGFLVKQREFVFRGLCAACAQSADTPK